MDNSHKTNYERVMEYVEKQYKSLMYGKGNTPEGNGYLVGMGDIIRFSSLLPPEEPMMLDAQEMKNYIYHLMEYREKNNEKPHDDLYAVLGHIQLKIEEKRKIMEHKMDKKDYTEPKTPASLNEAAEASALTVYPENIQGDSRGSYDLNLLNRSKHIEGFKAGAEWMARQGFVIQGSCTNSDGGFGVGVVAYNNDENHTTSCLVPSGMFNYGDKVIVQIRKAPGDEKKDTIEELVPRNLLTEDQIKEMNGFEYKTNAIKYINSVSNVGLKVAATYYELYNDKNLEDDDNRRES